MKSFSKGGYDPLVCWSGGVVFSFVILPDTSSMCVAIADFISANKSQI